MKWISIKDELPPKNENVFACSTIDECFGEVRREPFAWKDASTNESIEGKNITHWMKQEFPRKKVA